MLDIRPVVLSDLPLLRDLAERTFRDAWQADNEPVAFEQYCQTALTLEKLRAEWEQPESRFFLIFDENEAIAYLKLNFNRQPAELDGTRNVQIERLYVVKGRQSKGLGAQLLDFSAQLARENGATWLWLSAWQKSPRTVAFYERNGFSIFGVEIFQLGDDAQPDWLLKRRIAD